MRRASRVSKFFTLISTRYERASKMTGSVLCTDYFNLVGIHVSDRTEPVVPEEIKTFDAK